MADGMHPPKHIVLVPRAAGSPDERNGTPVRRFSLARVAVNPRSALGVDRHERLERIAERG